MSSWSSKDYHRDRSTLKFLMVCSISWRVWQLQQYILTNTRTLKATVRTHNTQQIFSNFTEGDWQVKWNEHCWTFMRVYFESEKNAENCCVCNKWVWQLGWITINWHVMTCKIYRQCWLDQTMLNNRHRTTRKFNRKDVWRRHSGLVLKGSWKVLICPKRMYRIRNSAVRYQKQKIWLTGS